MNINASKKPGGFTENTERRNCRRAVIALSLIAIAALGHASRAQDAADASDADTGLEVVAGVTWQKNP